VDIAELVFRFRETGWAIEGALSAGESGTSYTDGSSAGGQSKNFLEGNSNQRITGLETKWETSS
jgi:hypothetical protein